MSGNNREGREGVELRMLLVKREVGGGRCESGGGGGGGGRRDWGEGQGRRKK